MLWKTFHDFLYDYIKILLGDEWGSNELSKPYDARHPIVKIYEKVFNYRKKIVKNPDYIYSVPFTGAILFYMRLSYNLYIIAHNTELQTRLIKRLLHPNQFPGACYETYIAAIFIKAGFSLVFESEEDNTTSHCEFVATHKFSGKKYSVEVKLRHRQNLINVVGSKNYNLKIGRLLHQALAKNTLHERVIFIDLNLPVSEMEKHNQDYLTKIIKQHELELSKKNDSVPSAYIFLTNYPYHYALEEVDQKTICFAEGFNIPDYGSEYGGKGISLHEAIQARKKHQPLYDLLNSIKTHTTIPATFDGSLPQFTFSDLDSAQRLKIGEKYIINDPEGKEKNVELLQATVNEVNKTAIALCKETSGEISLVAFLLTDSELAAYKSSPDTFFNVYRRQGKKINNALEMFDFCMRGHHLLTKEDLLTRLKGYPNQAILLKMNREELLELYCEAMTNSVYRDNN